MEDANEADAPEESGIHYVRVAPRPALGGTSFQAHIQTEALKLEDHYRATNSHLLLTNPTSLPQNLPIDAIIEDIRAEYSARTPKPSRDMHFRLLTLACRYSEQFLGSRLQGTFGEGQTRYVVGRFVIDAWKDYAEMFGGEWEEMRARVAELRKQWMRVQRRALRERGALVVWEGKRRVVDDAGMRADLLLRLKSVAGPLDGEIDPEIDPQENLVDSAPLSSSDALELPPWLPENLITRFSSPEAVQAASAPHEVNDDEVVLILFHHTMLVLWHFTVIDGDQDAAQALVQCLTEGFGISAAAREHAVHTDVEQLIHAMMLTSGMTAEGAWRVVQRLEGMLGFVEVRVTGARLEHVVWLRECIENIRAPPDVHDQSDDMEIEQEAFGELDDAHAEEEPSTIAEPEPVFENDKQQSPPDPDRMGLVNESISTPRPSVHEQTQHATTPVAPAANDHRLTHPSRLALFGLSSQQIEGLKREQDRQLIHPERRAVVYDEGAKLPMREVTPRSSMAEHDRVEERRRVHPERRVTVYDEMPELFRKRW